MDEARIIRNQMQAIGKSVQSKIPDGFGFFVLVFKFGDNGVRTQYVSNAMREDILRVMQEFIDRNREIFPEIGQS